MAKLWLCFLSVALLALLTDAQDQDLERQLDPVRQTEVSNDALEGDPDRAEREKRLGLIKKIGLKAGLLDFVFGKIDSFIDSKTRFINELDKQNIYKNEKYFGITYPPKAAPQSNLKPASSGPPPVDFEVNSAVSLMIPDRLYGNSFTLVTNASKILGDVIYNTADRAQELADVVNSKLNNKFAFAKKIIKFAHPLLKLKGYGYSNGGSSSLSSGSSKSSTSSRSSRSSGSSSSSGSASSSESSSISASSSSSESSSSSINLLTKRDVTPTTR